jgi:hypothetical protein
MLLAGLCLVVLEDEDVVVLRHNSFAEPGQGRDQPFEKIKFDYIFDK